ncbi:hypothetical protein EAI_10312 [Harpegnathos saltator]|uniref:Ionotropic glutamate receptor C-terminal domain-containing protein n=1 Tax=Harpegnathos saltator TaxID=610380 RepID=E2BHK1_HARSA|nr:hypothetical protein EAI_10312 [Harpegnathos saltator]
MPSVPMRDFGRSSGNLTSEFILVVSLFLRAASFGDYQWRREAVEFWSDVICSMENCKTAIFHRVPSGDAGPASTDDVSRYLDDLVRGVARKCETTIVSRTYVYSRRSSEKSFVGGEDMVRENAECSSSIWSITFDHVNLPVTRPTRRDAAKRTPTPNRDQDSSHETRNTWNVHVVLAKNARAFDRAFLRNETFQWNPRDRFVVLIVDRRKKHQEDRENEPDVSIEDILRTLWHERKMYNVFVSEGILMNGTTRINRLASTFNPFVKINDSAWGGIDVVTVNTTVRSSNLTTHRCTRDLNGYELKVGIFNGSQSTARLMNTSITSANVQYNYFDIFKGFDETILDIIARRMNFTVKRVHPTDNKSFGYQLPNGTYIGAIEFTTQVEFDRVCVIAPKASKIHKWLRIYHFFPLSVWIFSMLSHILTYVTWHMLQVFNPRRTGRVNFLTTVYRSFLFNCGCPQKLPCTNAERILLSGIFLGNITIVGFFNGILYKSFAHDMYYRDIDSMEDLDASGLPILFTSFAMSDFFGPKNDTDTTPLIQSLRRKLRHGYNVVKNAAYYRNVTGLVRKHHFPILNEELVDTGGAPLLHLIKECPGTYYLSYLLPRDSILRDRVNALIARLNQAGLPTLWTSRTIRRIIAKRKLVVKRQSESEAKGFVAFSLSDLQTSFFTLLVGLSLSMVVFCHERGWLKLPFRHPAENRASNQNKR